ncbi:MAG: CpaF family protein, partial [Nanoarchaeota archaeon]|nr:CpaF family protein [Nanoarchaeota archaeon]
MSRDKRWIKIIGKRGQAKLPELPKLPSLPSKADGKKKSNSKKKVSRKKKTLKLPVKKRSSKNKKFLRHGKVKKKVSSKLVKASVKKHSKHSHSKSGKVFEAKIHREGNHGEVLESYDLVVDGAHAKSEIVRDKMGIVYNLYIPEISKATGALLDDIRDKLITATTVSMKELTDPAMFQKIKMRFMEDARQMLKEKLPHTEKKIEDFLVGKLMQEMLGLGNIEFLISDEHLEEIVIPSAKEPIRVFFKKRGWLITNIKVGREEEIVNYANIIARRVGKQITVLSPLLDAHLVTGDRINAVLYPVNTKGNTITIRKFARDPFTIVDMITGKTCSLDVASLLWLAIEYEMNVLISGGTGSGKTSFLNACLPFIPPNQRIISIEDTRELMLPDFLYWTPLVTRTPNPEGKGEVSMLNLLVNSLRMRPDRIILGEMRKQEEAMVLFEAMDTGHSVYSTVHADSAPETISRLVNPPLNVPPNLLKSVNLNVVMFRDRRKGIRRALQIAEFDAVGGGAKATILYRWVAERDEIVKHSESSRFFEDLSRNTGMSDSEIKGDLQEKKDILNWLIKNEARSLEHIGKVMNLYYRNKELLMKAIHSNN